jgi:hypothetical protein
MIKVLRQSNKAGHIKDSNINITQQEKHHSDGKQNPASVSPIMKRQSGSIYCIGKNAYKI